METYDNLKNAVVQQTAEDYAAAFMGARVDGKEPEDMMLECERFFHSEWYAALTNGVIDGDRLARKIKIRELEKTVKVYEAMLSVCNTSTFKAVINFPQEKGRAKKKPMNYIFPGRLADGIADTLRIQLESMKSELRGLNAVNGRV